MLPKEFSLVICALSFTLTYGMPYYDHGMPYYDHGMPYYDHGMPYYDHGMPHYDHEMPYYDHRQTYDGNYEIIKANKDVELGIRVNPRYAYSHSVGRDINLGVDIGIYNHGSESQNYDRQDYPVYDPNYFVTRENDYADGSEAAAYTPIYGLKNTSQTLDGSVAGRKFIKYLLYRPEDDEDVIYLLDGENLDEDDISFLNLLTKNSKSQSHINNVFQPFHKTAFETLSDYLNFMSDFFSDERKAWESPNLTSEKLREEDENPKFELHLPSKESPEEVAYEDSYEQDSPEISAEEISKETEYNSTEIKEMVNEMIEVIKNGILKYTEV